jgi:hypothetical protein
MCATKLMDGLALAAMRRSNQDGYAEHSARALVADTSRVYSSAPRTQVGQLQPVASGWFRVGCILKSIASKSGFFSTIRPVHGPFRKIP